MPARVTVYCKKPVGHLTAKRLLEEVELADLYTLAECLDLPDGEEAAVDAMKPFLRLEGETRDGAGEFSYVEVHWKKEGRPIQIDRVTGTDARAHMDEAIEELARYDSAGGRRVREHLAASTEIVYLELGIPDSLHLGATLSRSGPPGSARVLHRRGRRWARLVLPSRLRVARRPRCQHPDHRVRPQRGVVGFGCQTRARNSASRPPNPEAQRQSRARAEQGSSDGRERREQSERRAFEQPYIRAAEHSIRTFLIWRSYVPKLARERDRHATLT